MFLSSNPTSHWCGELSDKMVLGPCGEPPRSPVVPEVASRSFRPIICVMRASNVVKGVCDLRKELPVGLLCARPSRRR